MKTTTEVTIFLKENGSKEVKVERIRDGRTSTIISHYYVLKANGLTVFIDPDSLDSLVKSLKAARKRTSFDSVLK